MKKDLSQICGRCRFFDEGDSAFPCMAGVSDSERMKLKDASSCFYWKDASIPFSIHDDPSFSGHDVAWWEEWNRRGNRLAPICDGCVHWGPGDCEIHSRAFQRIAYDKHACADKVKIE